MTLEQFAKVQRKMAEESSLEEFLPTLWVLRRGKVDVNVLSDPPPNRDLRAVVEQLVETAAEECDCFYAFRRDTRTLECISRIAGVSQQRLVVIGE